MITIGPVKRGALALIALGVLAPIVAGCSNAERDSNASDTPVAVTATVPSGDAEATPMVSYFEPTNESFTATTEFVGDGPFVMLNLFLLKDVPDFTNHPEMEPETPMTTRELFYDYIDYMDSNVDKVGAKRIFLADSGPLLIGPDGEHWDVVQMVEYPSKQAFIDLAILIRPELLKREVMLADSRIMPLHQRPLDAVSDEAD